MVVFLTPPWLKACLLVAKRCRLQMLIKILTTILKVNSSKLYLELKCILLGY
jgi:hypothetical protein